MSVWAAKCIYYIFFFHNKVRGLSGKVATITNKAVMPPLTVSLKVFLLTSIKGTWLLLRCKYGNNLLIFTNGLHNKAIKELATRIKLTCLGATLAPYSSINLTAPALPSGGVSENLSFDVTQLQRGFDTTSAQQALYPLALSAIVVKYVNANHFMTSTIFVTSTQDQVNTLANS